MIPVYLDGPAVEPVGVPEMRAFLRLEHEEEDVLLGALIKAARLVVEATTRLVLVEQSWRLMLAAAPADGVVRLPLAPVLAVTEVRGFDAADTASVVPSADWTLERRADPVRLVLRGAALAAEGGLEIDVSAGYGPGAADVPAPLVQAIRLLVAHWFENRGDALSPDKPGLPPDVAALLAPFRRLRMGSAMHRTRATIGARRRLFTLDLPIETPDGFGGVVRTWQPGPRVWGAIEALALDKRERAGRPEDAVTHRVRLRHRADVDGRMRLTLGARRFAIRAATDPDGMRRETTCLVEEIAS